MFGRKTVAILVAEFLGTAILASIALSVSRSQLGVAYFVGGAVAFAFAVGVLTMGSTSGAHFNPAVTVGQWTIRKISTAMAIVYLAAQFLGGIAALSLYQYFVDNKISNIAGSQFDWRILVAEAVGAAVFTFGISAAIYQKYQGVQLAATVAISLFVGILIASTVSNGLLNPAIALGMNSWSKAYVVGPLVGGIVGMNIYSMLFAGDTGALKAVAKTTSKKASTKK